MLWLEQYYFHLEPPLISFLLCNNQLLSNVNLWFRGLMIIWFRIVFPSLLVLYNKYCKYLNVSGFVSKETLIISRFLQMVSFCHRMLVRCWQKFTTILIHSDIIFTCCSTPMMKIMWWTLYYLLYTPLDGWESDFPKMVRWLVLVPWWDGSIEKVMQK